MILHRSHTVKIRTWLAAAALAAVLPAAAHAQDRRGDGYMGILFGRESDDAARVEEVVPGSPADRAGIRPGDVVTGLNGRAATEEEIDRLRERLARGDTVRLRVRHEGREEMRTVVAAERPRNIVYRRGGEGDLPGAIVLAPGDQRVVIRMDTIAAHMDSLLTRMDSLRVHLRRRQGDSIVIRMDTVMRVWRDSLVRALPRMGERMSGEMRMLPYMLEFGPRSIAGAEFAEMNAGLGRYFHTSQGLLVLQVSPQTPAGRAGLQAGDVVVEANGRAVREVGDLREAFVRSGRGQQVRLTVLRDGARRQLSVQWNPPELRTWRVEPGREVIEERVRERHP
jgi:C-terminal processing protease CtpA/Prc